MICDCDGEWGEWSASASVLLCLCGEYGHSGHKPNNKELALAVFCFHDVRRVESGGVAGGRRRSVVVGVLGSRRTKNEECVMCEMR